MVKRSYKPFFRKLSYLFPAILFIVLLLNIVLPDRSFSEKENRVLASRPALSVDQILSGQAETKYETYVNDQFVLRDLWVTLKADFDILLGKTESNGVYLGKSGYLLESFTPPADKRLTATLDAITSFAQSHTGIHQYMLLAPNAVNILKSHLPFSAPQVNQDQYIDRVKDTVSSAGVTFIDVRDTLRNHMDEQLYYKTDHHWTTQAAYYAYLAASDPLELNTAQVSYEKLPASVSFQGTLSAKSGFRSSAKDELDVFLPKSDVAPEFVVNYVEERKKVGSYYAADRLKTRDKYAMFFDGNHAQIKITTPSAEGGNLLILKDSYANCLIPFLAPHYRNIVMIDPRYYYGNLEDLIAAEDIREILYIYNANTFFADTSLELTLVPQ
ncbi:MAG: hypothetical protein IJX90_06840 [Blautia sp.]|nr:hypothetical protein [Blautia sp.]